MSSSKHFRKRLILLAFSCLLIFNGRTTKTYLLASLNLLTPSSLATEEAPSYPECSQGQRAPEWWSVLRYGRGIHQAHLIPGAERDPLDVWYVWIVYRKHLFVFISQAWGAPGAVERLGTVMAWHGECVLRLNEWYP